MVSLGELGYSKATASPVKIVVAVAGDALAEKIDDLPGACGCPPSTPS